MVYTACCTEADSRKCRAYTRRLTVTNYLTKKFTGNFKCLSSKLLTNLIRSLNGCSSTFRQQVHGPSRYKPISRSATNTLLLVQCTYPLTTVTITKRRTKLPSFNDCNRLRNPAFVDHVGETHETKSYGPLTLTRTKRARLGVPRSTFLRKAQSTGPVASNGHSRQ